MPPRNPRVPSSEMVRRLRGDGGFTFDESTQDFASTGFYASQWGTELATPQATPEHVDSFRAQHAETLGRRQNFLGGWAEGNNDYLDVTKRFNSAPDAVEYGRRNAQLAAFDLNTFTELPIDYGASSLPAGASDEDRSAYNELGRTAIDHQLHGRAAVAQGDRAGMEAHGKAIADRIIQQEQFKSRVP